MARTVKAKSANPAEPGMMTEMQRLGVKLLRRMEEGLDHGLEEKMLGEKDGVVTSYVKLAGCLTRLVELQMGEAAKERASEAAEPGDRLWEDEAIIRRFAERLLEAARPNGNPTVPEPAAEAAPPKPRERLKLRDG